MNHILRNSHKAKSILIFAAACFLAAAVFLLLFRYDNKYIARAQIAQDGVTLLDCGQLDAHRLTYLVEGWEIYPNRLLSPGELAAAPLGGRKTYIGKYLNFSYFNPNFSPYGVATYRIRLRDNAPTALPRQYVLLFQENFSACVIYVNGALAGSAGSLAPYSPRIMDLAVPVTVFGEADVVVQISNYSHYYSGITYPPLLGTPSAIHRQGFYRAGFYGLLCFTALALALFSIAVWFGNRKRNGDRVYLWFGLLSLSFAARVCYPFIRTGGVALIRPLYALEDAAFLLGVWCTLKIALNFADLERWRLGVLFSRGALHMVLVGAVFPPLLLPFLPGFVPIYGQLIYWYKLLTALLLVGFAFYGALRRRMDFGWLLCGVGVYGTSLFVHVLLLGRFEPVYTGWQDEYGVFGLVLCFAVAMVLRTLRMVRENIRLTDHLQQEVAERTKRLNAVLEERRQFLAGAAHDLKAPMTSLQLFAGAIEEGGIGLDDETLENLRMIRRKSTEMQERLAQIQSFAMQDAQPQSMVPLDFSELLRQFYEMNLPDVEASGVNLLFKVPRSPCVICGDRQRLTRVLQNIVYNALSFTPMDGVISMTLEQNEALAILRISDTGCGISAEDLPHIFDRFFSRRADGGGSGLGLYLARAFVLEHGGEISVVSKQGEGTVFTISLPLSIRE